MAHEGKCHHELEYFNLKRFEGDESDPFEPNGVKRSQSLPLIIEQRVAWTFKSISDRFTDDIDSTKTFDLRQGLHSNLQVKFPYLKSSPNHQTQQCRNMSENKSGQLQ